ncbi:serine protease eatA domain protein [Escherichia coli STEC_DG131-3]|nr:serine protease eatA domain protein [Escherichia coli STEC_DG131-3]
MGDLRDINGEAGAWARIMSGTGSAGGGFSDNHTHVQVGVAKNMSWTDWICLPASLSHTLTAVPLLMLSKVNKICGGRTLCFRHV